MCCFSRPVELVADTNIFAHSSKEGRQFLVYSMRISAKEDLAMVLPIPVPKGVKEDAVRFISLEKYPDFFKDLKAGFPQPQSASRRPTLGGVPPPTKKLEVVNVGSYEASFVPTVQDFDRLDERFRLPAGTWDKLPLYKEYGFAVFKLKKGAAVIHPMAFEFPRKDPRQLFFPTVHIHDGQVHATAGFDHLLYCQRSADRALKLIDWRESPQLARMFMKIEKAQGLFNPDGHCYQKMLRGKLRNQDTWV